MTRRLFYFLLTGVLLLLTRSAKPAAQEPAFDKQPNLKCSIEVQPPLQNLFLESTIGEHPKAESSSYYRNCCYKAAREGNYLLALSYCDSLIQQLEIRKTLPTQLADYYHNKAHILAALHREQEAYKLYALAVEMQNSRLFREQNSRIRELQTTYELDRLALDQALLKARHHKFALYSLLLLLILAGTGVCVIFLSNRRTKRLQRELLHQSKRAHRSEDKKTAFINSMCHEVRTPLNCIAGFSELLCTDDITSENFAQYYDIIQENRRQLQYIFNDILEVAYLENLSEPLPRKYVALNDLCRTQLRLLKVKEAKPGIVYTSDIPNESIGINTNEKYLSILIAELLNNANKFTSEGAVNLACARKGIDSVSITVTDTGCGIPPEQYDYVFERFTKLDTFSQGNGLGLYLVQLIVQRLRGTAYIDPHYSDGTRIVVMLPRK